MKQPLSHQQLVLLAEKWLRKHCGVVFRDEFKANTTYGERPDALGLRSDVSVLIECKRSRADFLADSKKRIRQSPDFGMGDWRFYLCQPGIILVEELPAGWGLLHAIGRRVEAVVGVPGNCLWASNKPFMANKEAEFQMLYSALRKLTVIGSFNSVYKI